MVNIKIPEKYRPRPEDQEGARILIIMILGAGSLMFLLTHFTKILLVTVIVGALGLLLYIAFAPAKRRHDENNQD